MLNYCYVYGVLWSIILLFYSFGWSSLCTPLAPGLKFFFIFSIAFSFVIGKTFNSRFLFKRTNNYPDRGTGVTFLIVGICFLEYLYCGQIPIVSILRQSQGYTSFTGIPTLHTIISTFASFYAQYIFYLMLCFPERRRKLFVEYSLILVVAFLLQFNRGQILINLFISLCMFVGSNRGKIRVRHVLIIVAGIIAALYVFGGLGNMRHGYGWNDSWYIEYLGKYNDRYPEWLPKQFMWAYSYIVSPLSNLNLNVVNDYSKHNIIGLLITYLPDFISKRVFPTFYYTEPVLMVSYFTATAAFGKAYLWGGYAGIITLYLYLIVGQLILVDIARIKIQFKIPLIGTMSAIVAFTFFTHTISYSAISFIAIYPLLTAFKLGSIKMPRIRFIVSSKHGRNFGEMDENKGKYYANTFRDISF